MSLKTIRDQIVNVIGSVSGVGRVYPYLRWKKDWTKFIESFKAAGDDTLNLWMVTRRATTAISSTRDAWQRNHMMQIIGIYSLRDEDASEVDFQATIENVCDALALDGDLDGQSYAAGPPQVDVVDTRLYGTVLCHYTEITLEARDEQSRSQ